jgi:hypothetical protein
VVFSYVIAVIAPLAFLLVSMIVMCAGDIWWKSARLIPDAICWSIVFERSALPFVLNIRCLSAMLDPGAGATPGPGPTGVL